MNEFEVYQKYIALKNHFSRESYDYFKYGGKTRASVATYEKRRDRHFFKKIAKHRDPVNFMLASMIEKPNIWIGDIEESAYRDYCRRVQALEYNFKTEIAELPDQLNDLLIVDGSVPKLIQLMMQGTVSIETTCIIIDITKSLFYLNRKLMNDILWKEIGLRISKYTPFINYDRDKFKRISLERWR